MALFTEERLRSRVQNQIQKSQLGNYYDSSKIKAKLLLEKSLNEQRTFSGVNKKYDIFLSHSTDDDELVTGLKLEIADMGYSVYIDWIEDPELKRANVTKHTALLLQERMKNCKSLIYAFSENAVNSKWMPCELGYFDGIKGTVAVLPISKSSKSDFNGSEYLGIYYYIQINTIQGANNHMHLWIHETSSKYTLFKNWLVGNKPTQK
jgi:hypothetical protein